jgi:hypothetical protein
MNNFIQNNQSSGRDLKLRPHKHETVRITVLILQLHDRNETKFLKLQNGKIKNNEQCVSGWKKKLIRNKLECRG